MTITRPSEDGVRLRLREIGLDVPDACLPGVTANLVVLQDHMETLRALPLDERGAADGRDRA